MKTIIKIMKENKDLILITIFSVLTITFLITTLIFMSISADLVKVVNKNELEIDKLKKECSISSRWKND